MPSSPLLAPCVTIPAAPGDGRSHGHHSAKSCLTGPRRLEWNAAAAGRSRSRHGSVQTVAGAISIGSELPQYAATARGAEPPRYPRMTGYESVAVVVAVGEGVEQLRVGERVVAFYGHRTAALVPASKAIRVPEGVSDELALLPS